MTGRVMIIMVIHTMKVRCQQRVREKEVETHLDHGLNTLHEFVVHTFVYVDALDGAAALTRVEKCTIH